MLPSEGGYGNNAACVGGGTLSYGAMAWRFSAKDFRMRSTLRSARRQHARRLADHLRRSRAVLREGRVRDRRRGRRRPTPSRAPRRKPYPMPPFPYNTEDRLLEASARRLGFHPFDIPMLRNTVPYNGRAACMHCRCCVGLRLRGARQVRHAEHGDSDGARDRATACCARRRR